MTTPEASGATDPAGKRRRTVGLLLLGILPFLILAVAHWSTLPAAKGGDYAQYLLHAKAIVDGRSYGDIGYLFTPYNPIIGPRVQLPGWPLLLAPGVAVFGTSLAYAKLLAIIAAAGFLVFVGLRLARDDEPWIAAATAAIVGVALESTFATNNPISDLPFAAALWGMIWVADRPAPWTWRRAGIVFLLGGFAMATRVLGAAIVPALAITAFGRSRGERAKVLAPVIAWCAAGTTAVLLFADRIPFLAQTFRAPLGMLERLGQFWPRTRYSVFESMMYPFPWDLANDVYHAAGLVLVTLGLVGVLRRLRLSALGTVSLFYVAGVALAPVFDVRYLWPIWPVIVYAMLLGARSLLGWLRLPQRLCTRAMVSGVSLLVGGATLVGLRQPAPPALLEQPGVHELFAWLRAEQGAANMRVVFAAPRVLTLETGVPAMATFIATPERAFREFERAQITHVIVGDARIDRPTVRHIAALVHDNSDAFAVVYQNEGFAVYRLLPHGERRLSAGPS